MLLRKKVIFPIFLVFLFIGCKNDIKSSDDGLCSSRLENVSALVITNPTENDKPKDEVWAKIQTISKKMVNSVNEESELKILNSYVEKTPPYNALDSSLFIPNNSRTAISDIREQSFKIGEAHIFSDYDNSRIVARMVAEGEYCYIWQDDDSLPYAKLSEEEIEDLIEKFDAIYLKQINLCGPKYNGLSQLKNIINPCKKISILLTDIKPDIFGGFFRPYDYISAKDSAQMEVVVVDSVEAKDKEKVSMLYSTLVHEFSHLLTFVNKSLKYGLQFDTWYTEMLAMLTEDFFMQELGVEYRNSPQARLESFVSGGYVYGFKNWAKDDSPYLYCSYSNAYAFGAFLARNYGGAKLIHEICTNEYVNEESVVNAVNKINGTSKTFSDLLKEYSFVLLNLQDIESETVSLNKESVCKINDYEYHLSKIDLANLPAQGKIEIKSIIPEKVLECDLGAYGFYFLTFEKPTNIFLGKKDFLLKYYY